MPNTITGLSRRRFLAVSSVAALGACATRSTLHSVAGNPRQPAVLPPAPAPSPVQQAVVEPKPVPLAQRLGLNSALLDKAKAALDTHGASIARRDRVALVDFAQSSSEPRLHLVDLEAGTTRNFLVSHGSGSDPAHTGFLQRFSNVQGSNASSKGTYVTANYYVGQHGRSQRLLGLDPTNSNALPRAIVLHSAWYANADMLRTHGVLGRSQGCFAVGEACLDDVFAFLGQGRMIFADQVEAA